MVEIKRLTAQQLQPFLDFMEGPAFETNPQWAGCYCQFYLNTTEENEQSRDQNKTRACDRIASGLMSGYLAYEGDEVIAWTAANKANNFIQLPPSSEKAARILCFVVAPEHQNKGVATALLNFAIEDLTARGFEGIEATPLASDQHQDWGYRGKLSMFLKAGFETVVPIDDKHVLVHRKLTA